MTHTYSIVVKAGLEGEDRFDMEAPGPEAALNWAAKAAPDHDFEIFEDGRRLCRVRLSGESGYWTIAPGRADDAA